MDIVLASKSPRRQELLARIVPDFRVLVTDADENISGDVTPEEFVMLLAERKARAADLKESLVIGADTIVVCDGKILGKPRDAADAERMLKLLSGRSHYVYTGVCVVQNGNAVVDYEKTQVFFDTLSDEDIAAYVRSGEPMDKAGSYGIQGAGVLFVREIRGDYNNVVGLPLFKLGKMLKSFGF